MTRDWRWESEHRIRDFVRREENPFPPRNPLREHPVHRWDREREVTAAKDELDRRAREEREREEEERRERRREEDAREARLQAEREEQWERERVEQQEQRDREDLESTYWWADAAHRARAAKGATT